MEICICAAVKFKNTEFDTYLIIRGHRHCDCFSNKHNRPDRKFWKEVEQGFVTSNNRFVGREEGRKLQDEAGIDSLASNGYTGNTLFSEDLY